jgi:Protein of unknown function (DUF2878)
MAKVLINVLAFYIGWFACVGGMAQGYPLLGPLVVAGLLGLHLWLTASAVQEARFLVVVGLIGSGIDSVVAGLGLYSFAGTVVPWLCPPWITALWMLFGSTLRVSLSWLAGHSALAAVLGAVAGPLSYYAGARLGALFFPPDPTMSLAVLALAWGLTLPALLKLAASPLGRRFPPTATEPSLFPKA